MGVVLKVLVNKGPLGMHFLKKRVLTKQGTSTMGIFGTGILNSYHDYHVTIKTAYSCCWREGGHVDRKWGGEQGVQTALFA